MVVIVCIPPTCLLPLYVYLAARRQSTCCCSQHVKEPLVQHKGPDISLLKPQLQKQWHHAKNQHLGDKQVHPGSKLHAWLTCDQCPCGLPHVWQARVYSRQGLNSQCPFCTNMNLCLHNSLSTIAPSVASYWDTAKNGVTADQVVAGSNSRRHWLCPMCSNRWQAQVSTKVIKNSGCPKCSKKSEVHQTPDLDSQ